eukprot:1349907-Prymnesium_polylepis.1
MPRRVRCRIRAAACLCEQHRSSCCEQFGKLRTILLVVQLAEVASTEVAAAQRVRSFPPLPDVHVLAQHPRLLEALVALVDSKGRAPLVGPHKEQTLAVDFATA